MSENSTTAADAKLHPDDFELSINDLEAEYNLEDESIFSSDEEYMKLYELKFILKALITQLDRQLYKSYTSPEHVHRNESTRTSKLCSESLLSYSSRIGFLSGKFARVKALIIERLHKTLYSENPWQPRILRLCSNYKLKDKEVELFHLLTVVQGSSSKHVIHLNLKKIAEMMSVCELSDSEFDIFCDGSREHVKEGIVIVDGDQSEYYVPMEGMHSSIRISRVPVQLFYGQMLRQDELLKVSQTALETIVNTEMQLLLNVEGEDCVTDDPIKLVGHKNFDAGEYCDPIEIDVNRQDPLDRKKTRKDHSSMSGFHIKELLAEVSEVKKPLDEFEDQIMMKPSEDIDSADCDILPYTGNGQLEYLEDNFQMIGSLIKCQAARMKDDMKKEGTRMNSWGLGEMKDGFREIQAKLRVLEGKIKMRLDMTAAAGILLPRIELLTQRLKLDDFEKKTILFLIGRTVSPVVRALLDSQGRGHSEDSLTVGSALSILCPDFKTQIDFRKYFYKSSKLLCHGIVSLSRSYSYRACADLTDQKLQLDRRILDWAVGLDSEINELIEGSDLYEPNVNLCQVVLPAGHLQSLLSQCLSYDEFLRFRLDKGFNEVLSYGNSLVILLCGKSGTGKTMTANAIAKELGKKVLLVDMAALSGSKSRSDDADSGLKGLFREAHMNNAVLFFDECEAIFGSRSGGGDRSLNVLLTEIERHEGIVFMATNRPYTLDEAMHRRITAVVEYRPPDFNMRYLIWENLLTSGQLTLSPNVDIAAIAAKFELTGGFIKNAVMSALLAALNRDKKNPEISQEDLLMGCKLQMRGSLTRKTDFESRLIPNVPLKELQLSESHREAAEAIIRFEQARSTVYGSWSTRNDTCATPLSDAQRGNISLFCGPGGAGKKTLMKAIAFELDRSIKLVSIAELMKSGDGGTSDGIKVLRSTIEDAILADMLIAIVDFEYLISNESSSLFLARIVDVLHRFPGCVILLCNVDNPEVVRLRRDFAAKIFSVIKFLIPSSEIRANLWKFLLPPKAPLNSDINFHDLGRRFDLYPSGIMSAIAKACSEVAMRKAGEIHHKDLQLAGEAEMEKIRGGRYELDVYC